MSRWACARLPKCSPIANFAAKRRDRWNAPVPIGKAKVVREGTYLTIVTHGAMAWVALEAADKLAEESAPVEVVDLRTLLPLKDAFPPNAEKVIEKARRLYRY
jgi:pyruvate/2-oxoglutarate/acetoin dehydrogenase E1 component